MKSDRQVIELNISGLGIVFYSPMLATHIVNGANYLRTQYSTLNQVRSHLREGTIVSFYTSSPGSYVLTLHDGSPAADRIEKSEFKLRLGLKCAGRQINFRDLYDLMQWQADCPAEQTAELSDGHYVVTVCSDRPPSGIIGDNQEIDIYFEKCEKLPELTFQGIPELCF